MAAFQPRIEDPQMRGMGEGPYSREGFLSGWNFGNVFSVDNALSSKPDRNIPSMPANELSAAWEWNYHLAECDWRNPNLFVPMIMFFRIEGRPMCCHLARGDGGSAAASRLCLGRPTCFRRKALRPGALV